MPVLACLSMVMVSLAGLYHVGVEAHFNDFCGYRIVVVRQLAMLEAGVRFPLPALFCQIVCYIPHGSKLS